MELDIRNTEDRNITKIVFADDSKDYEGIVASYIDVSCVASKESGYVYIEASSGHFSAIRVKDIENLTKALKLAEKLAGEYLDN